MSSVLPDIHVNFNLFLVMYMYDQNFLLLDQDGVLVGNTVYVLSREKKLFAALHKHWNTFNNTLYMYTITNL